MINKMIKSTGFQIALIIFIGLNPSRSLGKIENEQKMIVINIRGANLADIKKYAEDKYNFPFVHQITQSNKTRPLKAVENAVTAVNLASFETGKRPSKHGVVGHIFGLSTTGFESGTSGFSQLFQHETFWETIAKTGKQVLNIGSLVTHGKYKTHKNVDLYAQATKVFNAQTIDLAKHDYKQEIKIKDTHSIKLSMSRDPQLLQMEINGKKFKLIPNEWLQTDLVNPDKLSRQAISLKWIKQKQFSILYIRDGFKNRANSKQLNQAVTRHIKSNPGWPNINFYMQDKIDKQTLIEEIEQETNHVIAVFDQLFDSKKYDLVLLDYPAFDRFGHAFVNAKHDHAAFAKAYALFDQHVSKIHETAEQLGYELIMVSGHGFSAVDTAINLNAFLQSKGYEVTKNWEIRAFPGKVSAHINLNPKLPVARKSELITQLKDDLLSLKKPVTNEPVVDRIHTSNQLHEIGLNHNNAGDLWVLLKPGFLFQNQMFSEQPIFSKPSVNGDHGFNSNKPESMGLIYSLNTEIESILDVAPYVIKKLLQ